MKTLTALAALIAGLISPSAPAQEKQLDRACTATLASITNVLNGAARGQPATIVSHLDVVTPGVLTARIAFNRSGSSIHVAADRSSSSIACGQTVGHLRGLGPGRSRVVSTLRETFAKPGHYTLTFALNQVGRQLLTQLGAAERAYRKHHPHGHAPPGLAYGVGFGYSSSG